MAARRSSGGSGEPSLVEAVRRTPHPVIVV